MNNSSECGSGCLNLKKKNHFHSMCLMYVFYPIQSTIGAYPERQRISLANLLAEKFNSDVNKTENVYIHFVTYSLNYL